MLTRSMCADWARYGIQANGIAPGYFRTDLNEVLQDGRRFDAWLRARVPAGRWGEPDELGGAVVFLASPASDFVNGQLLYVDGGLSAVALMLVIRGATVYPGEGAAAASDVGDRRRADRRGRRRARRGEVVDAEGLWLCPGFIDLHAHSALALVRRPAADAECCAGRDDAGDLPRRARRRRRSRPAAGRSGATTCARSRAPGPDEWPWTTFAEYLDALDATRPAISLVPSIGHGAVRDTVIGGERRPPTPRSSRRCGARCALGFEAGATNLSFGLVYLPGAHADTDELVAVAEVAAEFGAPLVPHVRNEGAGVLDGDRRDARGRAPLGRAAPRLAPEVARRRGADRAAARAARGAPSGVTFDQYPYGAGCTLLASLLPAWAQEGGATATLARLRDPDAGRADRARRRARPARLGEPPRHARPGADRGRRRDARRPRRRARRDGRATCCSSPSSTSR